MNNTPRNWHKESYTLTTKNIKRLFEDHILILQKNENDYFVVIISDTYGSLVIDSGAKIYCELAREHTLNILTEIVEVTI